MFVLYVLPLGLTNYDDDDDDDDDECPVSSEPCNLPTAEGVSYW